MPRAIKLVILVILSSGAICSAGYVIYWLFNFGKIKIDMGLFWAIVAVNVMTSLFAALLYLDLKEDNNTNNSMRRDKRVFFRGYTLHDEGMSIWPFKRTYLKWSDIVWVFTFSDRDRCYKTIVGYLAKKGHIKTIKFMSQSAKFNPIFSSGYCSFINYVCKMLPAEKICLNTRELAGYDTAFKRNKYRQSELEYQEKLARQLWLEVNPQQALKICDEILEKSPNNFWGMKIKACLLANSTTDSSIAIDIVERMINLKYFDPYVIQALIIMLMAQQADLGKIENYMSLFRAQLGYREFIMEFHLLNFYLDALKDFQKVENLLKDLEPDASKQVDPIYMKTIGEFYGKIAKLKASQQAAGNND